MIKLTFVITTLLTFTIMNAIELPGNEPSLSLAPSKPNIIIILADDSGYSDLGCYGGEIDTPHLDQLAKEGVRFRHFYNNARCSPTRASLMTGKDCGLVGFGAGTLAGWNREMKEPTYRARLPYEIPTLPELLKTAGYRTLMAGKWHLGGSLLKTGHDNPKTWENQHAGWNLTQEEIEADFNALPRQRGFDQFFGIFSGEDHQFLVPHVAGESNERGTTLSNHSYYLDNEPAKIETTRDYDIRCYFGEKKKGYPFHPADKTKGPAWFATDGITDQAIQMIQGAEKDRTPFFLYLAYQSPHAPLQAPGELIEKYKARYENNSLGEVEQARVESLIKQSILPKDTPYRKTFSDQNSIKNIKAKEITEKIIFHSAMMENMDSNIGRMVDCLRKSGQLDNTLIIYLSDNGASAGVGELMNKPYFGAKALLWEGGQKTAFIARWPGKIKNGTLCDTVGWVGDLLPTCLEVAHVSYPLEFRGKATSPLEGRSLLSALQGSSISPPEYIFTNDKGQQAVIYQGHWKLLINPGWYVTTSKQSKTNYELYHLENDPAEVKNVYLDNPELVEKLAAKCLSWQKKNGILDYGELLKQRKDFSE